MDTNNTDELRQLALNTQWNLTKMVYTSVALVVFSVASNSFTLVILWSGEIFNEIDLILFRLLAVEDMIASLVTMTSFILYNNFNFQRLAEPFFWYCALPCLYQTVGVVLSISICRYIMIVRPLHYPRWVTRKRIIATQAVLILMSFVLSFLLQFLAKKIDKYFDKVSKPFSETYVIPMVCGFLVQLFTGSHMLYISATHFRRLHKLERAMFLQEANSNNVPRHPSEPDNPQETRRRLPAESFKGLRTVVVIIGSYWIAWFPMVLNAFKEIGLLALPDWFRTLASSTALVNSCWNPLIYYVTNRAFRNAANSTIRSMKSQIMCKVCKTQTVPLRE